VRDNIAVKMGIRVLKYLSKKEPEKAPIVITTPICIAIDENLTYFLS
jgi:hypothetical protein